MNSTQPHLWQHLDGHIEGYPLIPTRVSGGEAFSSILLVPEQLSSVIDSSLYIHHLHVRVVEVVQSYDTYPDKGREGEGTEAVREGDRRRK